LFLFHFVFPSDLTCRSTEFYLKCCLLLRQGRVIDMHVRGDPTLAKQLEMCLAQLEGLIRGKQAFSVARLSEVAKNVSTSSSTSSTSAVVPTSTPSATPTPTASTTRALTSAFSASPLIGQYKAEFNCDSIFDSDKATQSMYDEEALLLFFTFIYYL
jgi:hypothetical protein